MDDITCSYLNMTLSFRGAERQPPNMLQMALRFSAVMEQHSTSGKHPKELNSDQRLRRVIQEFQDSPGFLQKWALDEDKIVGILNLICGTSSQTRDVIRCHLNKAKWAQSALNAELLRRPRWLLGATPAKSNPNFKSILKVTEGSQCMFMELVVQQFYEKSRKVRPNQRARLRLTGTEWDAYCNYACVFFAVMKEAENLSTCKPNCKENLERAFACLCLGRKVILKVSITINVDSDSELLLV